MKIVVYGMVLALSCVAACGDGEGSVATGGASGGAGTDGGSGGAGAPSTEGALCGEGVANANLQTEVVPYPPCTWEVEGDEASGVRKMGGTCAFGELRAEPPDCLRPTNNTDSGTVPRVGCEKLPELWCGEDRGTFGNLQMWLSSPNPVIDELDEDPPRLPEAMLRVDISWADTDEIDGRLAAEMPVVITETDLTNGPDGSSQNPRFWIHLEKTLPECLDLRASGAQDNPDDCPTGLQPWYWRNPEWLCTNDNRPTANPTFNRRIDLPTTTPVTIELTELINPDERSVRPRGSIRARCIGVETAAAFGGDQAPGVVEVRIDF